MFSGITSGVTATGARLSPLSDVVEEAYAIRADALLPLEGGYRNDLWHAGEVVVRVERTTPASVAWEHSLLAHLAPRIDEVVTPLPSSSGSSFVQLGDAVVSVWPYVDGRPARRRRDQAVAAADLLARLHRAAGDWAGGQRSGWQALPGDGPQGPIHGDVYPGNVLVRRGRIAGLVDWEESHVDLLAYDLANAVWEFCKDKRKHDFDRRLATTMLAAYGSELTPEELVPLIVARLRYELELWGGPGNETYRRHLLRSLRNLGD